MSDKTRQNKASGDRLGSQRRRDGVVPDLKGGTAVDNPPFASVRIGEEGLGRERPKQENIFATKNMKTTRNVINIKENQPADAIFEVQS